MPLVLGGSAVLWVCGCETHLDIYIILYYPTHYIYTYIIFPQTHNTTKPTNQNPTSLRAGVFLEMARVEEFVGNKAGALRILEVALSSRECKRDWKISLER